MTRFQVPKKKIEELLNLHSLKAQSSSYDRGVCVLAVSNVREKLMAISTNKQDSIDLQHAISEVAKLAEQYSDPDGEYTSGKSSVIGLLDDLYRLKFDQEEPSDHPAL
ncbi:hypothetical protein [Amphritea japonica]|uniref:hypothetical protein n=1 Tax=Amphritea japonica TaxID=452627 RepID=UPI000366914F|nr:hypothetical protein [Amphritea japonica]